MSWAVPGWGDVEGLVAAFGGRKDEAPPEVHTLRQMHGREVRDVRGELPARAEGDALVSDEGGRPVGVWTADCVPVLLLDRKARVVAAVHSGWRGTLADVVGAAVSAMGGPAAGIEAAIGPAIGGCCYEVGEEVRAAFLEAWGLRAATAFGTTGDRVVLDLRRFLESRLGELGLSRVEIVGPCTACSPGLLFSYRREGSTGRQLSWIGLRRSL